MKRHLPVITVLSFMAACAEAPTAPALAPGLGPAFTVSFAGLSNASFEEGYTDWAFDGLPGQYIDIGTFWKASHGSKSVDLNGVYAGWISQQVSTVSGAEYTVTFDLAGNPGSPQNVKKLEVAAAGTSARYEFDTNGRSTTNMGWTTKTFSFTATDATTTLLFKSLHRTDVAAGSNAGWPDRGQGPAVDNVRVSANPTTADQCKNGGWNHFGFRNQGLCIQYVNTGKDSR